MSSLWKYKLLAFHNVLISPDKPISFIRGHRMHIQSENTITTDRWLGFALKFIAHAMIQFAVIRIGIL
jgi:hypothetical protein